MLYQVVTERKSYYIKFCLSCGIGFLKRKHEAKTRYTHRVSCSHHCGNVLNKRLFFPERTQKVIETTARGEKHFYWKGGITPLIGQIRWSPQMHRWREAILKRDNYTCRICERDRIKTKLTTHHDKPFYDILMDNNITTVEEAYACKELWDMNNGQTLCQDCHWMVESIRGEGIYQTKRLPPLNSSTAL